MITDGLGNELTYWPISGLAEGETSEVLAFTADVTSNDEGLSATLDSRVKTWARKVGDGAYIDISQTPYDLTGITGETDFEVYVEVLEGIEGLERIPITVSLGTSSPAGWST